MEIQEWRDQEVVTGNPHQMPREAGLSYTRGIETCSGSCDAAPSTNDKSFRLRVAVDRRRACGIVMLHPRVRRIATPATLMKYDT